MRIVGYITSPPLKQKFMFLDKNFWYNTAEILHYMTCIFSYLTIIKVQVPVLLKFYNIHIQLLLLILFLKCLTIDSTMYRNVTIVHIWLLKFKFGYCTRML